MTLHLIKLSVGPENLSDLEAWQKQRLSALRKAGKEPELIHVTRHLLKRSQELLDGGSIYWVIKGWLCARQRLLELRPMKRDGQNACGIVFEHDLIRVIPRQHRAFQGWRYFKATDAPRDLPRQKGGPALPEDLSRELAELGLL